MNARRCLVPECADTPAGAADLCPRHEVQHEVPQVVPAPPRLHGERLGPAYFVTWHVMALEALVKTGHLAPRQLAAIRRHYTENPAAILRGLDPNT